jgi:hypothetical protein
MTYDGELVRAESGETGDDRFYANSPLQLMHLVSSLKDGDTIVINAHE